ncbi:19920_t:CDS:1, partial [Cetraspora pellucida]
MEIKILQENCDIISSVDTEFKGELSKMVFEIFKNLQEYNEEAMRTGNDQIDDIIVEFVRISKDMSIESYKIFSFANNLILHTNIILDNAIEIDEVKEELEILSQNSAERINSIKSLIEDCRKLKKQIEKLIYENDEMKQKDNSTLSFICLPYIGLNCFAENQPLSKCLAEQIIKQIKLLDEVLTHDYKDLWESYKNNIDSFIRLLNKPSMNNDIKIRKENLEKEKEKWKALKNKHKLTYYATKQSITR